MPLLTKTWSYVLQEDKSFVILVTELHNLKCANLHRITDWNYGYAENTDILNAETITETIVLK